MFENAPSSDMRKTTYDGRRETANFGRRFAVRASARPHLVLDLDTRQAKRVSVSQIDAEPSSFFQAAASGFYVS